MEERIPIIIDTDPGIDDAIAIMLAQASDRLEIVGLTPVDGNVPAAHTFQNALDLSEFLGIHCPVAKGAQTQLELPVAHHGEDVHGATGLGKLVLPAADADFDPQPAWDFIYEKAKAMQGRLVLVAIGPLTNVAKAIRLHPDLREYLREIVLMGGGTEGGNRTPFAEFNFWVDPPAAQIVFESGIPITMAGLNVTLKTGISIDFIHSLAQKKSRIGEILEMLVETYNDKALGRGGRGVSIVHDAIPVFFLAHPECCTTEQCKITVNTVRGSERWGQSVADYADEAHFNTRLITDVDMRAYERFYEEMTAFFAHLG